MACAGWPFHQGPKLGGAGMTTLKIDLDGKVTPCRWLKWCRRAAKALSQSGLNVTARDVRRSPSGGVHVRIEVEESLTDIEVVAMQAILGSDSTREALNFERARAGAFANVLHTWRDGGPWGEPWPQGTVGFDQAVKECLGVLDVRANLQGRA